MALFALISIALKVVEVFGIGLSKASNLSLAKCLAKGTTNSEKTTDTPMTSAASSSVKNTQTELA